MSKKPKPSASAERRLAAVLMADVAGFSRLVGEDEAGTLALLAELQETAARTIAAHGGRIANTAGDSVLAEFASTFQAVQCALALQAAGTASPGARQLVLRIGIHVGEVLVKDGDIFGEAVNVAARLQALAEPGGIVLSDAAHAFGGKLIDAEFVDLGTQLLKNIAAPVRGFAVRAQGAGVPALRSPRATAQPGDQPSVVVLPFSDLSATPDQAFLSDGIVEDITLGLAHVPRLFVVARNTAFTYKGKSLDVRSIGRELGVRYVLGGSIRRAGDRLRVSTELTDAAAGHTIWAERFDRQHRDVFALQDEIAAAVVGAMAPWLIAAEIERVHRLPPERLEAYHLFLRALPAVRAMSDRENAEGLALVHRALELDDRYAVAAGLGAWAHTLRLAQGWRQHPMAEGATGLELAERALRHGRNDAEALSWGGYAVGFLGGRIEEGLVAVDRALALNPNSSGAFANGAWLRVFAGQVGDAIAMFEAAERLSPKDPELFRSMAGRSFCHLFAGELEQSVAAGRAAMAANPAYTPSYRAVAAALGHLGAVEEAGAVLGEWRRRMPDIGLARGIEHVIFRSSGRLPYLLDGLRRAGLPD